MNIHLFHGNYYYFLLFCFNNLLYLCAHKQNRAMTYSGEGKTGWGHFNPIVTILFAWWLLHEQITPWFILGTLLILAGMYLCDKRK